MRKKLKYSKPKITLKKIRPSFFTLRNQLDSMDDLSDRGLIAQYCSSVGCGGCGPCCTYCG